MTATGYSANTDPWTKEVESQLQKRPFGCFALLTPDPVTPILSLDDALVLRPALILG